jgi:hypothetical protein
VLKFRRLVEVVLAEQRDPAHQELIFEPDLERSLERDQTNEGKRREQDEPESVESRPDARSGSDQPERNQAARGRGEEHRCPPGRLGDRGRSSALQREVLGRHEVGCRWAWTLPGVARGSASLVDAGNLLGNGHWRSRTAHVPDRSSGRTATGDFVLTLISLPVDVLPAHPRS